MIAHMEKYERVAGKGLEEMEALFDKRSRGAQISEDDWKAADLGSRASRSLVAALATANNAELLRLTRERLALQRAAVASLPAATSGE